MYFKSRFRTIQRKIAARFASEKERAQRRRVMELSALIDSDPEAARLADEFADRLIMFVPPPDRPEMTWEEALCEGELGEVARRYAERLETLEARSGLT